MVMEDAARKIAIILVLISIAITECVLCYPNEVIRVTDDDLDSVVIKYPLFVLDCYKSGCTHCDNLDAVLGEIIHDFQGEVVIGEMDMDNNLETKEKYNIHKFPMLLFFKNGKFIDKINGFVSKIDTEKKIASYLSLHSPAPEEIWAKKVDD
jgi:thioredoxin 1